MILQWLKDGWRTSNLKKRQTRTAWSRSRKRNIRLGGKSRRPVNVLFLVIESGLSNVLWAEDTTMSIYLVNKDTVKGIVGNKLWRLDDVTSKVVLYRNMGFNENGEYKKTFIGSGVGTGSMQVLQGDEFEVELQEDHTFEVEPHMNVDHVVGSQEVQTQDLMDYQLARDREQHLACELFGYREDSNEAAFVVAAVEKIYAHESLTFNDTVACEVISKWKAGGLKDDMDAGQMCIVLSNGCRNAVDATSLGACVWDVEQNGKVVMIYAEVEPGVSDRRTGFFMDFDYAMGRSITRAWKKEHMAKGTFGQSRIELKFSSRDLLLVPWFRSDKSSISFCASAGMCSASSIGSVRYKASLRYIGFVQLVFLVH
ncbi:hypothetical protein Tco_0945595 [Tanacetum coccineum]